MERNVEKTLAIIKPDATASGQSGVIISRIEKEGLRMAAAEMAHLDRRKAEGFYYVHDGKPFFETLITFMTSGPCFILVLVGENAIERWRNIMGATNPANAERGTLRRELGTSLTMNATHGSDSPESAAFEIGFFFKGIDILTIDRDKVFSSCSTV